MPRQTKRRKVSADVSQYMPITKPGSSTQSAEQERLPPNPPNKDAHSSSRCLSRPALPEGITDYGYTEQTHLLVPHTSMSDLSVHKGKVSTSSTKSSFKPGETIYGSQWHATGSAVSAPTHPLLSSSSDHRYPRTSDDVSYAKQPDAARVSLHRSNQDDFTRTRADPRDGALMHAVTDQAQEGPAASVDVQSDDLFEGDDEDFAQSLAQLEYPLRDVPLETSPSASRLLPTPLNSDSLTQTDRENEAPAATTTHADHPARDRLDYLSEDEGAEIELLAAVEAMESSLGSSDSQRTSATYSRDQRSSTERSQRPRIVRKPFPTPIQDRSPIFGASSGTLLRTCFRVGEAIRAGTQAVRTNQDVVLKLYARMSSTWRPSDASQKQHFIFRDLYHEKPPHLSGVLDFGPRGSRVDFESQALLQARCANVECRVIAKMTRDGQQWVLDILRVSETDWSQIDHVAGIYAKDS